jgi:hypothetical protein
VVPFLAEYMGFAVVANLGGILLLALTAGKAAAWKRTIEEMPS